MKGFIKAVEASEYFQAKLAKLQEKGRVGFSGLVGSSAALICSLLVNKFPNLLIVTASSSQAEAFLREIAAFNEQAGLFFPAPDTFPGEPLQPSKEILGERLTVLKNWQAKTKQLVVAPVKAVLWPTVAPADLAADQIIIKIKAAYQLSELIERLITLGYRRQEIVGERGEFSVRGGIVDIFAINQDQPIRLELSDNLIESIRYFDSYSQRSLTRIDNITILAAGETWQTPLWDHWPEEIAVVFLESLELDRAVERLVEEERSFPSSTQLLTLAALREQAAQFKMIELSQFLQPGEEPVFTSAPSFINRLADLPTAVTIFSRHGGRLREELDNEIYDANLPGGFCFGALTILSDRELFGEAVIGRRAKPLKTEGVADELLADLKEGDYVVHEDYGIALFRGMETLDVEGINQEYLLLEFAGGDTVYVPPTMAGLVEKYASGGNYQPKLSRLGSHKWLTTKAGVKKVLKDMTEELLKLYATREKLPGFAFPPDDLWQAELAGTFPYATTPDQQKAIEETKQDMVAGRPMDRLVCGDVGYGKTEVAIRAAAKAVAAGKQVAILVPTTILAEQHFNNFKNRFAATPFVVEMLSRFKAPAEQKLIVRSLAQGGVDIVIGTHRLLSKDVKFKDLGLLVIDEEQRFGVAHKEKIKQFKQTVDVLTLTATPIPRTLYLALSGARSMSVINTPPVDRSPIRTYILPWSEAVVREAIRRELDRGGQIYLLHNFVETIEGMAAKVKRLVPEARVAIGHGQMPEQELEKTMLGFLDGKYDVLVCTSIIESGLDISNVNTILIDQADRFGLSQLYQIRGRVGRSAVRAYAYLFYQPQKLMTDDALERLKAIQEFTALGSGYKLAMRDLEIRGAGNLLGAEQSGRIADVGFDLYCELLEEAVKEVKGVETVSPREVSLDLKVEGYIPKKYVNDDRQRIALYRRMNLVRSREEMAELKNEMRDRFGPIPDKLERLLALLNLKVKALSQNVRSVKEDNGFIVIERFSGKITRWAIKGQDKLKIADRGIAG